MNTEPTPKVETKSSTSECGYSCACLKVSNLDRDSNLHYAEINIETDELEIKAGRPFTMPANSPYLLKTGVKIKASGIDDSLLAFRFKCAGPGYKIQVKDVCTQDRVFDLSYVDLVNYSTDDISFEKDQTICSVGRVLIPQEMFRRILDESDFHADYNSDREE